MSSETEQVWARTLRKLHPIFPSELDAASKPIGFNGTAGYIGMGTNDVYGPDMTFTPAPGWKYMYVIAIQHDIEGTFGVGETVTVKTTVFYADGSSQFFERSYTSAGNNIYGPFSPEIIRCRTYRVVKVVFNAKTSAASTNVGLYLGVDYLAYN